MSKRIISLSDNKSKRIELVHKLDREGIDLVSESLIGYFENRIENDKLTRVRLSIEESLGSWLENAEEEEMLELKIKPILNGYRIKIAADGPALDPYDKKEETEEDFGISLLVALGLVPEYSREGGRNCLVFKMKRKPMNPVAKILCVIAGAILLGMAMNAFLPASVVAAFNKGLLTPLYSAFFRLLGAIAGPMIFLSVTWGIYGIGDAITLGRIGKKLFAIFLGVNALYAVVAIAGYPFLGPSLNADSSATGGASTIFQMILDIIPSSIVTPFAEGNTLQIIFMAIIVGTTLIYLGKRTENLANILGQANNLVQYLMRLIAEAVPAVTFLVVLNLVISGTISVISESWKLLVVSIPILIIATIIVFVWGGVELKTSPIKLMKKSSQIFLLGLSTASSSACFEINMRTTRDEMGVDDSLTAIGVPLGTVISRTGVVVFFQLICYFFASEYGVHMSWQTIITLTITTVFLTVSLPPVPGGTTAGYVALLAAAGIPNEAMATALSLNVIMDFIMCAFDVVIIPVTLAILAKRTGRLNADKLK